MNQYVSIIYPKHFEKIREDKHGKQTKRDLANELTEWLATRSIGIEMLYQIGVLSKDTFIDRVDGEMMKILLEIIEILEDKTLDDPTCFKRIDAIVDVFQKRYFNITRHDW